MTDLSTDICRVEFQADTGEWWFQAAQLRREGDVFQVDALIGFGDRRRRAGQPPPPGPGFLVAEEPIAGGPGFRRIHEGRAVARPELGFPWTFESEA